MARASKAAEIARRIQAEIKQAEAGSIMPVRARLPRLFQQYWAAKPLVVDDPYALVRRAKTALRLTDWPSNWGIPPTGYLQLIEDEKEAPLVWRLGLPPSLVAMWMADKGWWKSLEDYLLHELPPGEAWAALNQLYFNSHGAWDGRLDRRDLGELGRALIRSGQPILESYVGEVPVQQLIQTAADLMALPESYRRVHALGGRVTLPPSELVRLLLLGGRPRLWGLAMPPGSWDILIIPWREALGRLLSPVMSPALARYVLRAANPTF